MKRKKRIAVIGLKGLPAFGGAATVGENHLERLRNEFDFTVFSVSSHTDAKTGPIQGVHQIVFKQFGKKGGINTLAYYFKSVAYCLFRGNYDLVHLHHGENGFITPLLRLRYKVLVTLHGVLRANTPKFGQLANRIFRWGEKQNVRLANEVVSVSSPDCDFILQKYKREIRYIPNGIELLQVSKQELGKPYLFFAAARIFEVKGLHLLLKALRQINFDGKLVVAGDDQVDLQYMKELEPLREGLDVEFIGLIKDKEQLFSWVKGAELFLFPSLTEAMSMMLLEVAAQKVPLIASDIPANKAIFSNEEVLLFETENVDDLVQKLQHAFEHPGDMQERAARALKKVQTVYTWDQVVDQYRALYEQLS